MAQYIRRESGVLLKEDEIIFLERDWHQKPSVELTIMPKSRRNAPIFLEKTRKGVIVSIFICIFATILFKFRICSA